MKLFLFIKNAGAKVLELANEYKENVFEMLRKGKPIDATLDKTQLYIEIQVEF